MFVLNTNFSLIWWFKWSVESIKLCIHTDRGLSFWESMCFYIYVDICKSTFHLLGGKRRAEFVCNSFSGHMDIVRPGTRQSNVRYPFLLWAKYFMYISTCLSLFCPMISKFQILSPWDSFGVWQKFRGCFSQRNLYGWMLRQQQRMRF